MDRWEALSELVHDTASQVASGVNNGGESDQVDFLLQNGWGRDEIEKRLAEMVTEDASEEE